MSPPAKYLLRSFSTTCWRTPTAPSGMYELVSPFAIVTMSGTMSPCSKANILPVRPKPAMTSSHTSMIPYFSVRARNPFIQPFGGMSTPFVPVTLSTKMAAMSFGFSYWMSSSR